MPTTQLLGSAGHVGSTWNTGMPADFAGFCAAPGSTHRPTIAITISPSHTHRIVVFRIHAPFIKARGPRRWRAYTRRWRGGSGERNLNGMSRIVRAQNEIRETSVQDHLV